jgi:hypothetical protein
MTGSFGHRRYYITINNMKTFVFILGAAHSGTTLVDVVLGSNSQSSSLGELSKAGRQLKQRGSLFCQFCGEECDRWFLFREMMDGHQKGLWHKALSRVFNTPFLIDSSKSLSWASAAKKAYSKDKNCRTIFIHIVRDGISCLLKTKRKKGFITPDTVKGWVAYHKNADQFLSTVDKRDKYVFRYEDLCKSPSKKIADICHFVGMDFEESMMHFWEHEHHFVAGNAKPISLVRLYHNKVQISDLHPDVQDFFNRYGYSIQLDTRAKERMSKEDVRIFQKYGRKTNSRNGY